MGGGEVHINIQALLCFLSTLAPWCRTTQGVPDLVFSRTGICQAAKQEEEKKKGLAAVCSGKKTAGYSIAPWGHQFVSPQ